VDIGAIHGEKEHFFVARMHQAFSVLNMVTVPDSKAYLVFNSTLAKPGSEMYSITKAVHGTTGNIKTGNFRINRKLILVYSKHTIAGFGKRV